MKIEKNTDSYNDRRYGRPYIAVVDFATSTQGECRWGDWIGQAGCEGILVIEAAAGEIVMIGQKDQRRPRDCSPNYFQVGVGGELIAMASKAAAYQAWKESSAKVAEVPNPLAGFSAEELRAELARREGGAA